MSWWIELDDMQVVRIGEGLERAVVVLTCVSYSP